MPVRVLPSEEARPSDSEQLEELLAALSEAKALQLARELETKRAVGDDRMPASMILDRLRPVLSDARPARVPTLCRTACEGFEDFLVDGALLPGAVRRPAIVPWWNALGNVAKGDLRAFQDELVDLIERGEAVPQEFGARLRRRVRDWTRAALAIGTVPDEFRPDAERIVFILDTCEPVLRALRTLRTLGGIENRTLSDTSLERALAVARGLVDAAPEAARFFPVALIRHIDQPAEALRLAPALGRKETVGLLLQRLLAEIDETAAAASSTNEPHEALAPAKRFLDTLQAFEAEIDASCGWARTPAVEARLSAARSLVRGSLGRFSPSEVDEAALASLLAGLGPAEEGSAAPPPKTP